MNFKINSQKLGITLVEYILLTIVVCFYIISTFIASVVQIMNNSIFNFLLNLTIFIYLIISMIGLSKRTRLSKLLLLTFLVLHQIFNILLAFFLIYFLVTLNTYESETIIKNNQMSIVFGVFYVFSILTLFMYLIYIVNKIRITKL